MGRFAGTPTLRGNRSPMAATLRRTWYPNRPATREEPAGSSPTKARPSVGHRSPDGRSGGSDTTIHPPTSRKADPHSAVRAGVPNDRDVTASNCSRIPLTRPSSSARPRTTSAFRPPSQPSSVSERNPVRRSLASMRTIRVWGQHETRTSPGTPPPVPRSMALARRSPDTALDHGYEPERMVDLVVDRHRPEESELERPCQRPTEQRVDPGLQTAEDVAPGTLAVHRPTLPRPGRSPPVLVRASRCRGAAVCRPGSTRDRGTGRTRCHVVIRSSPDGSGQAGEITT